MLQYFQWLVWRCTGCLWSWPLRCTWGKLVAKMIGMTGQKTTVGMISTSARQFLTLTPAWCASTTKAGATFRKWQIYIFLCWTHHIFLLEDATHHTLRWHARFFFGPYLKETKYQRTIKSKVIQKVLWPSKTFTWSHCAWAMGMSLETCLFAQDTMLLS